MFRGSAAINRLARLLEASRLEGGGSLPRQLIGWQGVDPVDQRLDRGNEPRVEIARRKRGNRVSLRTALCAQRDSIVDDTRGDCTIFGGAVRSQRGRSGQDQKGYKRRAEHIGLSGQ